MCHTNFTWLDILPHGTSQNSSFGCTIVWITKGSMRRDFKCVGSHLQDFIEPQRRQNIRNPCSNHTFATPGTAFKQEIVESTSCDECGAFGAFLSNNIIKIKWKFLCVIIFFSRNFLMQKGKSQECDSKGGKFCKVAMASWRQST